MKRAPSKLTATMTDALAHAEQHGALVRWPGGFWTYPDAVSIRTVRGPVESIYRVPVWYVGWGTVKALLDRARLHIAGRGGRAGRGRARHVILVKPAQMLRAPADG